MGIDAEMFVRTRHAVTDADLQEWHYRFGCAFHEYLWKFGTYENKTPENLFLFRVNVWEQDGPDIHPEPGETFLKLRPMSSYYGPGYERGDFPVLKAMAEFLELLIPESEVWYGGDSSGVCAKRFGPAEREAMLKHFVAYQHTPYLDYRGKYSMQTPSQQPICPWCVQPCPQFGFGGSFASYTCLGCGWKRIERDGKIIEGWTLNVDEFGREKAKP